MLQEVTAKTEKITVDAAYNAVTSILIDKGFDIKMANKDIGIITTEYKQFASVEPYGKPPFDLYLQIKVKIKKGTDGKVHISLSPISKDVNRLNAAAFTEHELIYLTPEEQKYPRTNEKAYLLGQIMFNNVVIGVSELTGIGMEQLEYRTYIKDR